MVCRRMLIPKTLMLELTTKSNVFVSDYDCKTNSQIFNGGHSRKKFFSNEQYMQMKREYDDWCEQNVDWH